MTEGRKLLWRGGEMGIILLEVLLKPGTPYSSGGTPEARKSLFFWRNS
jgi:hypothetical protein